VAARRSYLDIVVGGSPAPPRPARTFPALAVVSFSGERDVPEQVASIRSFLAHVGEPARWTVVSDGSHTPGSRVLLSGLHACVAVLALDDAVGAASDPAVARYARRHAMGKKLALELSLPVERPTLYVDADVLFFGGGRELGELVDGGDRRPRYLQDCGPYFDPRLLARGEARRPVNGGAFLLWRPLDWQPALARLRRLRGAAGFFTEQTLLHLAMHASGARPLDAERYVVSRRDEHSPADAFAGRHIVLRHYTTPVRHKFWGAVERFGA
jgi:hypothetical protein